MYIIKSLYVNEYQLYTLLSIIELVHHKQQINMQIFLHGLPSNIKRKIPIFNIKLATLLRWRRHSIQTNSQNKL